MRTRGSIAWIGFSLLPACNLVFGLDPPTATDALDITDAPVDAPRDGDGDGIIDVLDVCPDAADPEQYDEDLDRVGDRCDLCPHLDQNSDADNDEDNIPDDCDPLPGTAAGRLRFFGFHTEAELGGWRSFGSGIITVENDALRVVPTLDAEVRFTHIDDENAKTNTRVMAGIDVDLINAGGITRRALGVVTNLDGLSGVNYFLCQIETDIPVTQVRLAEYRLATPNMQIVAAPIGTAMPLGPVRMEFDAAVDENQAASVQCEISGTAGGHVLFRNPTTEHLPGESGVRTVGVPMRVRWIAIIDHP